MLIYDSQVLFAGFFWNWTIGLFTLSNLNFLIFFYLIWLCYLYTGFLFGFLNSWQFHSLFLNYSFSILFQQTLFYAFLLVFWIFLFIKELLSCSSFLKIIIIKVRNVAFWQIAQHDLTQITFIQWLFVFLF